MNYKGYDIIYVENTDMYRITIQEDPIRIDAFFDTIEEAKNEIDNL